MVRLHDRRGATGFSLLEVLVAVVVLTVGLLALAALQGSLTRASADAKVRARVATMLTARIDDLRSGGYGSLVPEGAAAAQTSVEGTAGDTCDLDDSELDWLDCARVQSNLGSLTVQQTINTWYGAGTFATPAPVNQDPRVAQFKRVSLLASWTDAAGGTHQAQLLSDVSSMSLTNFIVVPPDPTENPTGGPIVRTINPATSGVIPIAMGPEDNEQISATTNPTPELVGQQNNQQIVGTRFSVLNYTPPGFGNSVVITKRFDNEVIKCSCRFGAGGNNLPEIYRTALWPAIWTGEGYEVHVPDGNIAAPGQAAQSGRRSGVTQSELCQECCRDHHDTGTGVEFDPERSDGIEGKYDIDNNGNLDPQPANTNNGNYVDACRLVRVDGFWRTASDLYQRQYGLLETQPQGGVAAKSGLPTTTSVTNYTTFVKSYLARYDGTGSGDAPTGPTAQEAFVQDTSFNAATINIAAISNTDYRYLHGRGLYVDHLEQKAREKIAEAEAENDDDPCPDGSTEQDCVLQFIPFLTANLTEIAEWTDTPTGVITVNTANLLSTNPAQPSGGRTIGSANGSATNESRMRLSNSGVAVSATMPNLKGVDPGDMAQEMDSQAFTVGGTSGPTFDVNVSGGGANPFVFFTLGSDVDRECLKPAGVNHRCVTSEGTTLPQQGTIAISNYWVETTTSLSRTANCGGSTATDTVAVPTFRNYELTTATVNGVGGVVGSAVNDNLITESTSVLFGSIPQGGLVQIGFTEQAGSPTYATIVSCTTNGGGNKINNIVWSRPWIP
jgi:type II secretory pathway pseudopilin PulG